MKEKGKEYKNQRRECQPERLMYYVRLLSVPGGRNSLSKSSGNRLQLGRAQFGEHRQREDAARQRLCDRKTSPPIAQRSKRPLKMKRNRVMNAGFNPLIPQDFPDRVPPVELNNIKMVNVRH